MLRLLCTTLLSLVLVWGIKAHATEPAEGLDLAAFVESQNAVLLDFDSSVSQVKPGGEFTLALRLTPHEGLHIYGVEPTDNLSVISSELTLDETAGIKWGEPIWPAGTLHETPVGDAYWLVGQQVVLIPGAVATDATPGLLSLTGNVLFSACSEEFCLAPNMVPVAWKLEIVAADYAGEIATKTDEELLAPITIDQSRYIMPEPESEVGGGLNLSDDGAAAEVDSASAGGGVDLGNLDIKKSTEFPMWKIILLALLGGLVLNIMPCVLPVVSIKVIDLVSAMEKKGSETVKHGLLFALGIIATFLAGSIVIAIIQALGTKLNWGFQFQNPTFVLVMSLIIFIFALSLADMFKIKAPSAALESGGQLAKDEGAAGSFFKGVLATVLGTPCVGPFLGPALAVAFTLTWVHTILIFAFVGIGMALPYFIMLPFLGKMSKRDRGRLSRKLQEGKGWMDHFKHAMSFLLFATVIYLLYIMQGVLGGVAIIWTLMVLLGVAIAAWLWGTLIHLKKNPYLWASIAVIVTLLLTGWLCLPRIYAQTGGTATAISAETHAGWEKFELAKLQEYTSEGRTVLVDFTADWCPNCKTNEAVALNIDSTMTLKEELGVIFMVADFTQRDAEIGDTLRALGFTSVPLTAIFPGSNPNAPLLLDGLFTASRIQDAMREAAGGAPIPAANIEADGQPAGGFDLASFIESKNAVLLDCDRSARLVKPGETFLLALRMTPFEGLHIYGVEPTDNMSVIPSELTFDAAEDDTDHQVKGKPHKPDGLGLEGISLAQPQWPAGTLHETPVGDAYWLVGQPVVLVSGEVAADAAPGLRKLAGQVLFSACSEEFCLAPSQVPVEWTIEVVPADFDGEIETKSAAELQAPVEVDQSRYTVPEPESAVGGGLDLSVGEG